MLHTPTCKYNSNKVWYIFKPARMTSPYATNYRTNRLGKQRFLEVDENGYPLQGQVAKTRQLYEGQGNETIQYDGSTSLIIMNSLTAGPLVVDFSAMNNWMGRDMNLVLCQELDNTFTMDFGSGTVIVPGVPSALHSTTTPAGFGPLSGVLIFISINQAALVKNPVTFPNTIIPGDNGQFLGTVAGIAQWTDLPPSGATVKTLTLPWYVDSGNELNNNTASAIQWNTADSLAENDTTLTITNGPIGSDAAQVFTTTDVGYYGISGNLFFTGPLNTTLRTFVSIDSTVYCVSETSIGNTGQRSSFSLNRHLDIGQEIRIFCGNADGPQAPGTSFTPVDSSYGILNITQFI